MNHQNITPKRRVYVVSFLILIIALGAFVWSILASTSYSIKEDQKILRFLVPGTHTLLLGSGEYTIYNEYMTNYGGHTLSNWPKLKGLSCTLTSNSTNQAVKLESSEQCSSTKDNIKTISFFITHYSLDMTLPSLHVSKRARSAWHFEIEEPGVFTLTASYPDAPNRPYVILSVGQRLDETSYESLKTYNNIFHISIVVGIIALVTLVVTFFERRKPKPLVFETSSHECE